MVQGLTQAAIAQAGRQEASGRDAELPSCRTSRAEAREKSRSLIIILAFF